MLVWHREFLVQLYPKVMTMVVSFGIVALSTIIIYYLFFKKTDVKKHKNIAKKRLIYVMIIVDILIVTKIWVEGFSQIITVLSFMAAGLVVANKESVMNIFGGLIINWRDLFVEGDFIQVQHFSGYVFSIGIMYFRIYETTSIDDKRATGRTIKIPNSLVIAGPVVNFSPDSNLYLYKIHMDCLQDSSLVYQVDKASKVIEQVISDVYKNDHRYTKNYVKSHNRELSGLIKLEPSVSLEQWVDKDLRLRIVVKFYCFSKDHSAIVNRFWLDMEKNDV